MKIFNKYIIASFVTVAGLISCETDVTVDDFTNGEADFSEYVALGDSLTAGFSDGALYKSAQENSFPAILAEQFAKVGGGEFKQPLVQDENGGFTIGGNVLGETKFELAIVNGSPAPVRVNAQPTTEILSSIAGEGPYNNLGVPGAKTIHLLSSGYGNAGNLSAGLANPYYVRFANPDTSILEEAMSQDPTFYTLWIGNNDVLGYALSGGEGEAITPSASYAAFLTMLVDGLESTGAEGVLVNIPAIETIPYFSVVPYNAIPLDEATANFVNTNYAQYNGAVAQYAQLGYISEEELKARTINFVAGQNAPVIEDDSLATLPLPTGGYLPKYRHLKEGERMTLPASSILGTLADPNNPGSVIGVGVPLDGMYVLDNMELDALRTAVKEYNRIINDLASENSIPVFNFNQYLENARETGISYQGATATVDFVTGGIFSLDGIHATQKGNAIIANELIKIINSNYNANVPQVNIKGYPGVVLP